MSKSRREAAMPVKWLGLVLMALTWSVTAGHAGPVDGFDYPFGPPDGTPRCLGTAQCAGGWQNVQDFRVNNHLGEDWNLGFGEDDLGKPVYAVANGVVTYAQDVGGDGSWKGVITIRHSGSNLKVPGGGTVSEVTSLYGHLDVSEITTWVSVGSAVSRGQQIGVIGPTPVGSTGPHLHFEIRTDTTLGVGPGYTANATGWIDPSDFINGNRPANQGTISGSASGPYTFATLAGSVGKRGFADGPLNVAKFSFPMDVATDNAGNMYVADGSSIRKITPDGFVSTLANFGRGVYGVALDRAGNLYAATYNDAIWKITPEGFLTNLTGATDFQPYRVAVDSVGNVYVSEPYQNRIRKITPTGVVATFSGIDFMRSGSADGTVSTARFYLPFGLAVDTGDSLYVADSGNHIIRKITPDGVVSTLAGSAGNSGSADGTGSAACFFLPQGVAVDSVGNVYVADGGIVNIDANSPGNQTIRKITPSGVVSTLAGSPGVRGIADGTGSAARFNFPSGLAVDSVGNLYVADCLSFAIRIGWPGIPRQLLMFAQPQSQIAIAGTAVTFRSGAISLKPVYQYQWQRDGVDIPGATNASYTILDIRTNLLAAYRVVVANEYGTVTSSNALLTLVVPPINQIALQRASANFSAGIVSPAPLSYSYQWLKDGISIVGATNAFYSLTGLRASDAGVYGVVISSPGIASNKFSATLTVVSTVRRIPSGYWPGVPLTIEIECVPTTGSLSYTVTERIAPKHTATSINEDGLFDSASGTVRWGPFFDDSPRVFRYTIFPAPYSADSISFSGTLSEDGRSSTLPQDTIYIRDLHPADNSPPADNFITLGEIAAYAAAWRRNDLWPVPPNPINADYVTQAGVIWRRGEYYESVGGFPPLNWQPKPLPPGVKKASLPAESSGGVARKSLTQMSTANGMAVRSLTSAQLNQPGPFDVTITVTPQPSVTVLVLEEQLPPGWTATNINSGGAVDPNFNKVKWGPFFLNQSSDRRTYTYQAVPPTGAQGAFALSGQAAFDGAVINIGGSSEVKVGSGSSPQSIPLRAELSGKEITLSWPTNSATFVLEVSDSLGPTSWTRVSEAGTLVGGVYSTRIPVASGSRFYRLRAQ